MALDGKNRGTQAAKVGAKIAGVSRTGGLLFLEGSAVYSGDAANKMHEAGT